MFLKTDPHTMYSKIILFCFLFCNAVFLAGNGGYEIKVKIKGAPKDTLYLAYYYGDKQYIKDTVAINTNGEFIFHGEEALKAGVYIVVLPPDNKFFEVLISDQEQHFSVESSINDLARNATFKGSKENELFYQYMRFISDRRPIADSIAKKIKEVGITELAKQDLQNQLDKLDVEVEGFQKKLIADNPKSFAAAMIKANLNLDIPTFDGDEKEVEIKRWRYAQNHYFDNIDLGDPRLVRTPFLFQRVNYYITKLQVQHPDTIAKAVGYVLDKMRPAEETFKFYLIHFLNEYANSNMVGMDAVYVYLVDNYYAKGAAPWTDSTQLVKIIENSNGLKPTLIGKVAPNLLMQKKDGSRVALHDVDSDYTILYFWKYDCGHCKESTPILKKFYEKFKDKGVKIFAVCFKFTDEVPKCWDYIDENGIQDWLHTVDPYHRTKFADLYFLKTTPQIFILDRKKEILIKRIGAEQLEEVMDEIIKMKGK